MQHKIRSFLLLLLMAPAYIWGNQPIDLDCTSYFSWEPVSGANASIKFTNLSTGDFNTWMWDFGDGQTSGIFHPTHTYNNLGTYYVCLTISDGQSCYDVFCDTVEVVPDCQADFDITYVPTTPPLVQFTDLSTGYPDEWFWTFGDGYSSTQQNPVHTYTDPGTYEVCLFISHSDTLYSCSDTICQTVIIPDSIDCEADYSYNIDEGNPLKVHFTDQSVGNITDWEWNFGDGHTSTLQNPEHVFSQPGQYLVCLKVENNDTLDYCIHFICETITLYDSVLCQAGFSAIADSNSQVMYRYSFFDESTGNPDNWAWDFGDGHSAYGQHPVHIYDEPGTYEVCLSTWNSGNPGCSDSYCLLIQTADYFQLGGLAFIGENPLNNPYPSGDTGIAILYRQQGLNSFVPVDTNMFHELGYYWFSDMMELGYMIRISLTPASGHYEEFIPSYFPGVTKWQEADVFMLNDNMFEMHTSLVETLDPETGPGSLSGRVVSGRHFNLDARPSFRNVPVILADQANTPLSWTATDEYGQFRFDGIALGTYVLYADVAGIWSQAETVVLSESFQNVDTILIRMYENAPFAIEENIEQFVSITSLYPNPTVDDILLEINSRESISTGIRIFSQTGQEVFSSEFYLLQGSNTLQIPAGKFPSGIYLLSLHWTGQKHLLTKKFIKK
ncbi:MAG TPA: PKD domain-containing protein [Bacteroidales bacterium]|nr:PKD domain-containing protein [Bacteroidales bacterium]